MGVKSFPAHGSQIISGKWESNRFLHMGVKSFLIWESNCFLHMGVKSFLAYGSRIVSCIWESNHLWHIGLLLFSAYGSQINSRIWESNHYLHMGVDLTPYMQYMNASMHTYKWPPTCSIGMSRVTSINDFLYVVYEWITSHIWMPICSI